MTGVSRETPPCAAPGPGPGGYRMHVLDVITAVLVVAVLLAAFWPH